MISSIFSRPLAVAMFSLFSLVSVALPGDAPAQEPALQSFGQSAVNAVLKQEALDPSVHVPSTRKSLSTHGSWTVAKEPPPSCPQESHCATVFYKVPEADVSCQWTVALNSNNEGTILDQNADASRYMVRTLPQDQAKALVLSRKEPAFPGLANLSHMSGEVIVRLSVSTSGKPEKAAVVSASNPVFGPPASDAALGWKFKPLMVGAQAVRFQTALKFTFDSGSATVTSTP